MRQWKKAGMRLIMLLLLAAGTVHAKSEPDYIVMRSLYSIDKTLKRFEKLAKERGFLIVEVIDHRKRASQVGLRLHPQKILVFSAPKSETRLMNVNPRIGLEFPLKVGFYKDRGKVKLIYKNPAYYERAFHLKNHRVIQYLKKELKFMSNEAIN